MGDSFDFGEFHEAVLNQGTIPVKYLPELFGVASESGASWGLFVRFREIRECSFHG